MQTDEHATESEEGYHAQSGSQTIDTVYKINCIHDIDNDKDCEWYAHIMGQFVNAKQSVEIVETKARSYQ